MVQVNEDKYDQMMSDLEDYRILINELFYEDGLWSVEQSSLIQHHINVDHTKERLNNANSK